MPVLPTTSFEVADAPLSTEMAEMKAIDTNTLGENVTRGNLKRLVKVEMDHQNKRSYLHTLARRICEGILFASGNLTATLALFLVTYYDERIANKWFIAEMLQGKSGVDDLGIGEDLYFTIVAQSFAIFAVMFFAITSVFIVMHCVLTSWNTTILYTYMFLQVSNLILIVFNLELRTETRWGVLIPMAFFTLMNLMICLLMFVQLHITLQAGSEFPLLIQSLNEICTFSTSVDNKDPDFPIPVKVSMIESMEQWLFWVRGSKNTVVGRKIFLSISIGILVIFLGTTVTEMDKILAEQDKVVSANQLEKLWAENKASSYDYTDQVTTWKVMVVVMSGLRYDHISSNTRLSSLLSSTAYQNDIRTMKLRSEIPSRSVPNWLSMLSGTTPEFTGQLNDWRVEETSFETVLNVTKNHGLTSCVIGPAVLGKMVKSQLSPLTGDGVVPSSARTTYQQLSFQDYEEVDAMRFAVAQTALASGYDFSFVVFSDIDSEASKHGVTSEFNSEDTYNDAIDDKVNYLETLFSTADSRTLILVTSDHGHLDRGGTGGISDVERNVPLIAFRSGSSLKHATHAFPTFGVSNPTVANLASTISFALGVPCPRDNMKNPLDELILFQSIDPVNGTLQYLDIFRQKQGFQLKWQERWDPGKQETENSLYQDDYAGDSGQTKTGYIKGVNDLDSLLESEKLRIVIEDKVRNYTVTIVASGIILVFLFSMMQLGTFASPASLVCWPCILHLHKTANHVVLKNFAAAGLSFLHVLMYYTFSITLFCLLMLASRFEESQGRLAWDTAVLSTPLRDFPLYILATLVPGVIFLWLAGVVRAILFIQWDFGLLPAARQLLRVFTCRSVTVRDVAFHYLQHIYTMFFTVVSVLLLFLFAADFTFICPGVYRIPFFEFEEDELDEDGPWRHRFRILTVFLISYPLALASLMSFYNWSGQLVKGRGIRQLYQLSLVKENTYFALMGGDRQRKQTAAIEAKVDREVRRMRRAKNDERTEGFNEDVLMDTNPFAAGNIQDVEAQSKKNSGGFVVSTKSQLADENRLLQANLDQATQAKDVLKFEVKRLEEEHTMEVTKREEEIQQLVAEKVALVQRVKEYQAGGANLNVAGAGGMGSRGSVVDNADELELRKSVTMLRKKLAEETGRSDRLALDQANLEELYNDCERERASLHDALSQYEEVKISAKDPRSRRKMSRFGTMGELQDTLNSYKSGAVLSSNPAATSPTAKRKAKKRSVVSIEEPKESSPFHQRGKYNLD